MSPGAPHKASQAGFGLLQRHSWRGGVWRGRDGVQRGATLAAGAEGGTKPITQPSLRSTIGEGLQWLKSKFSRVLRDFPAP